jgi:hypothetical protein
VPKRKKRDWVSARAIYRQWQKSSKPPMTEPKRNDKQVIKELRQHGRSPSRRRAAVKAFGPDHHTPAP